MYAVKILDGRLACSHVRREQKLLKGTELVDDKLN